MKIVLVKSAGSIGSRFMLLKSSPNQTEGDKLSYFKKKILDHLSSLEEKEKSGLKKSLFMIKGGRALPVGTIKEWKGNKYIKLQSGKWKRKYETQDGRGIKMSLAAIRRQVDKVQSCEDLMKIVLDNRDRFSDIHGNPLPIIQELSAYVAKRENYLTNDKAKQQAMAQTAQAKKKSLQSDLKLQKLKTLKVKQQLKNHLFLKSQRSMCLIKP